MDQAHVCPFFFGGGRCWGLVAQKSAPKGGSKEVLLWGQNPTAGRFAVACAVKAADGTPS